MSESLIYNNLTYSPVIACFQNRRHRPYICTPFTSLSHTLAYILKSVKLHYVTAPRYFVMSLEAHIYKNTP